MSKLSLKLIIKGETRGGSTEGVVCLEFEFWGPSVCVRLTWGSLYTYLMMLDTGIVVLHSVHECFLYT